MGLYITHSKGKLCLGLSILQSKDKQYVGLLIEHSKGKLYMGLSMVQSKRYTVYGIIDSSVKR